MRQSNIKPKKIMIMKRKIVPMLLVAFLMIGSQSLKAQAKEESPTSNKGAKCTQGIPDLTDQQKQKIDDLCLAQTKEMTGLNNQMNEKYAHLKTLQTADKADMAAINKTIDEISALKADMMKKCSATRQSVRGLLTDKQKVAFDANKGGCCSHGFGNEGGCCSHKFGNVRHKNCNHKE